MLTNLINRSFLLFSLLVFGNIVYALPSLQLGPGDPLDDWIYDNSTDTWVLNGFGDLEALATDAAWETAGLSDRWDS